MFHSTFLQNIICFTNSFMHDNVTNYKLPNTRLPYYSQLHVINPISIIWLMLNLERFLECPEGTLLENYHMECFVDNNEPGSI